MAKGMKDKFDSDEGAGEAVDSTAPKGHGGRHGKRKKKARKHKGRG